MTAMRPHGTPLTPREDARSFAASWVGQICVANPLRSVWAPSRPDPCRWGTYRARIVVRIPSRIGAHTQFSPRRHNVSRAFCIPLSCKSCLILYRRIRRLMRIAGFTSSQTRSGARFAALTIRAPSDTGETRNLLRVQVLSKPCRNFSRSVTLNGRLGNSSPGSAVEGLSGWFK